MDAASLSSLAKALSSVSDPRRRRGRRHPYPGLVCLVFLGLLARLTEMAVLVRWAAAHWETLRGPLGFDRPAPPHATTLSRALARLPQARFGKAFAGWLAGLLGPQADAAAVDGKTSKQGLAADGNPVHMLNVFAHDAKACLAQWAVGGGDKKTEPETLKAHLDELFSRHPGLRLLTGDAVFCQRHLAGLIVEAGRDYLFMLKGNQPEALQAAREAFVAPEVLAAADKPAADKPGKPAADPLPARNPDAEQSGKRGPRSKRAGSGSTRTRPTTSANGSAFRA
jgi:hypothetical protein